MNLSKEQTIVLAASIISMTVLAALDTDVAQLVIGGIIALAGNALGYVNGKKQANTDAIISVVNDKIDHPEKPTP